jgi:uncharacterized phage-associated protein
MTLLKVLYFAHGWHLAKYGQPLVAQPFEAWKHGPVNRVVYDQLKGLGKKPVCQNLKCFDAKVCGYVEARANLDGETTQFLNNIFDYYARFHAFELSDLTHEQGSPWDVVWQAAEARAVPGMFIPDSLIVEWFRGEGKRITRPS